MTAQNADRSPLPVLVAALVGGAGTMTVELAAVRLLAPWYGTSLSVWTNVIAVVLLALALGYALGGRLSARGRPLLRMSFSLGLAAVWTAILPFLAGALAPRFVPEGLALDGAADVVLWGSLATSLLLFLPPATVLGTVAPLAVEAVQERGGGTAGRAGGSVLAASTLGSLAGVFGTSHVLIPVLGLRGTFLLAAGALAAASLAALLAARPGRTARAAGVATLLLAAALGAALVPRRAKARPGTRVLAATESPYQSLRIVEDTTYGDEPLRFLKVNEGFDSYQSVWQPEPGVLPEGFYYNDFALPLWWERDRMHWRVLVLGLGGGTAFRVLEGARPAGTTLDRIGVELDPGVVALAEKHLDLDPDAPGVTVAAGVDARVSLATLERPLDLVLLDCYTNQVEIPPHLATAEFFSEVRASLSAGGWLVANLGGFGLDDPVVRAVGESAAAGFASDVALLRVPRARNLTLVARRDGPLPLDDELVPWSVEGPLAARVAPLGLPGAVARVAPPARAPLTDDHAPLEVLQLRSIREARERLLERGAGEASE